MSEIKPLLTLGTGCSRSVVTTAGCRPTITTAASSASPQGVDADHVGGADQPAVVQPNRRDALPHRHGGSRPLPRRYRNPPPGTMTAGLPRRPMHPIGLAATGRSARPGNGRPPRRTPAWPTNGSCWIRAKRRLRCVLDQIAGNALLDSGMLAGHPALQAATAWPINQNGRSGWKGRCIVP